ncbi:large conductance mechanosensitive channel protein MscL [Elioraea rosea]|uniref:large conductance mechanosensitive channel protein MscL n=1 Tax=Elioraea rosea TaxID=2492390 RepID=UPI001182A722|nr:large conductance mechanosensitive channel protein MscL [Elioraea rosea]
MQTPLQHLPSQPAWVKEFKAFIMRGNVIDLAVGIIIGAAFTAIVGSLVTDIFNPLLGMLLGGIDFSNLFIVLSGERQATLEATREGGAAVIAIGVFINACINFIIVGFAIFWLIKVLSRFKEKQPDAPPPGPTTSEVLLAEIRDLLKSRTPQP